MKITSFIKTVWELQGNGEAYFCISSKNFLTNKWKDHMFQYPQEWKRARTFLNELEIDRYHYYFCPLPFKTAKRDKNQVIHSRLLWSDLDEQHPKSCNPQPQMAWRTSPGRYSALWILDEKLDASAAEELNRSVTYSNHGDPAGWDLTQVLRIPKTINHKYDEKPKGRLLWVDIEHPLSLDEFKPHLIDRDPQELYRSIKDKLKPSTRKILLSKTATKGKRSDVIWRLENELSEQGCTDTEIFILVKHSVWNKFAGRRDEDGQLRRELDKIRSKNSVNKLSRLSDDGLEINEPETLQYLQLSKVKAEHVKWLWYPYIPHSKVTLIEGDPGLGKSWVTLALASMVSKSIKLPGQEKCIIGGRVAVFSAEDGIADTIRPRADALGAKHRNIYCVNQAIDFDEEGLPLIDQFLTKIKPCLAIIDPIVAYMGSADLHKANETRAVMTSLARLAEKHQTTFLVVRHLTKGGRDKSIYRGLGSIDITAAARSALMIGPHPEDANKRCIVHIKSNLAARGATICYSLKPDRTKPFRWEGFDDEITAEQMMSAPPPQKKNDKKKDAVTFLIAELKNGPIAISKLRASARKKSIVWVDILDVKKDLQINIIKRKGTRFWTLSPSETRKK